MNFPVDIQWKYLWFNIDCNEYLMWIYCKRFLKKQLIRNSKIGHQEGVLKNPVLIKFPFSSYKILKVHTLLFKMLLSCNSKLNPSFASTL
jgi:hypothetical protein